MRKICLILVLLLAMPVFAVAERYLTTIHCDNQGFTTMCLNDQSWEQLDDGGLVIWVDQPGSDPYVSVRWDRHADNSDPEDYFDDEFTPLMEETYGDRLMDPSDYTVYQVEGVPMPGVQYAWEGDDGRVYITFRLLDTRWEGLVAFTATYYYEERDGEPMNVLSRAVFGFQPDAAADAAPEPAPAPKTQTNQTQTTQTQAMGSYQVSAAPSIVPETAPYQCAEFTATLPKGWKVETGGLFENFSFRCYDPQNPERCLFLMGQAGAMHKSQAGKQWWMNYPGGFNFQKPIIDNAIVLPQPSIACLVQNMEYLRAYTEVVYPMHLDVSVLPPEVVPDIKQATVWEISTTDALQNYVSEMGKYNIYNTIPDASVVRFGCVSSRGVNCEGMVGGVVLDTRDPFYLNPTLDVWFYIPCCVTGVTAPVGELQELEPTLMACLDSFRFTDSYIRQAQGNSQVIAEMIDMQSSWDSRDRSYDIISQKYSDATLGYDRLYDSDTGEVYRADLDFYDGYDLHRGEFSNPNLYRIDDASSGYYLQGVDYYITR